MSNPLEIQGRAPCGRCRSVVLYGADALVRAGLRSLIHERTDLCVTAEVDSSAELAAATSQAQPDVVVIDLASSPPDDPELLRSLRAAARGARLLALAPSSDLQWQRDAMALGASCLVTKRESADAFLDAIEGVSGPKGPAVSSLRTVPQRRDARPNAPERLSTREVEVARLVCQGLRNETIGRSLFISEATVRHHLTAIFAKRRVASRAELIIDAHRNAFLS